LLLPPAHPFWKAETKLLPAEAGDFQLAVPQAGLVVRGDAGAVEVLNNANGICVGNIKFGTWKWGKLSYRTAFGFEINRAEDRYPLDAALTAEFANGAIHGRHQCQPLAVTRDHCGSVYGLGDRFSQNHVSVESRLWWKGGWQLHWHRVVAYQPATLRLGTYSLPLYDELPSGLALGERFALASTAQLSVAIQPLLGFARIESHESDPEQRVHLLAWHSLVLAAQTEPVSGEHDLVALVWSGRASGGPAPWQVTASETGRLQLRHPTLGHWDIAEPGFPAIVG
jgi:hypothetical protein